jgi:hypothetical protein
MQILMSILMMAAPLPPDAKQCGPVLAKVQQALQQMQWEKFQNSELKSQSSELRESLARLRSSLHSQLPTLDRECNLQVRDIFRQIRNADDFIASFSFVGPDLSPADVDFQAQPVPKDFEFRDGDVMLARGTSFFSAIISQLSDNRSHFSHAFVVHVDSLSKKIQTIESYVGKGVRTYDIDYALKNENVRLIVLRPRDSELGARAAQAALGAAEKKLPYDYKLDFEDAHEMSCVEVPTYAYKTASNEKVQIPLYPAHLNLHNSDFLNKMLLKNGPIITPDDIETDPRFELIKDWKDDRLIRDSRQKDAVLAYLVSKLDKENFQFPTTLKSQFVVHILLPLRQTFFWQYLIKIPKMPEIDKHIPPSTLAVMTSLDQTAQSYLEKLKKLDDGFQQLHGRVMTNEELAVALTN